MSLEEKRHTTHREMAEWGWRAEAAGMGPRAREWHGLPAATAAGSSKPGSSPHLQRAQLGDTRSQTSRLQNYKPINPVVSATQSVVLHYSSPGKLRQALTGRISQALGFHSLTKTTGVSNTRMTPSSWDLGINVFDLRHTTSSEKFR